MKSSSKVALNTFVLYSRMFISMIILLYSTRIVLNALGNSDYGIFNLLAGIIAMLSFLNAALSTSTQRYISFHQGKKDKLMQLRVFATSVFLHLIIGVIIVIGIELAGIILLNGFLNIPPERLPAAKTIYHFMSVTIFFTVAAAPFNALLMAYEDMIWVAIISIVETLLKLFIAFLLLYITGDKLIVYGILTAGISFVLFVLFFVVCYRKYKECRTSRPANVDFKLMKELSGFAGWNLFGTVCFLARTQGTAVMLNLFFGTLVNAAYGIANQVSAQFNFFSATLLRAMNPQIMKSEGANDRNRMLRIAMMASKFGFFLMAIFAIPCIFEMKSILTVWLKQVPDHTIVFCNLTLITVLVNQLTIGVQSAVQAIGQIKLYQIVVGSIILVTLPLGYLLLKLGYEPHFVLIAASVTEFLGCILRLYFLKRIAGLPISDHINRVFSKEIFPVISSVATCFAITYFFSGDYRFLITITASGLVFIVAIYFTGLCADEKMMMNALVVKLRNKFYTSGRVSKQF